MIDIDEAIRLLQGRRGEEIRFFEIYSRHEFKAYRYASSGGVQSVTVTVLDAGPGAGENRYSVSAKAESGVEAHGNNAGTLDEAIAIVHWYELDRSPS
jgi:hypothetical protein